MSDLFAWPTVLGPLLRREDLSEEQAGAAMGSVLAGEATPAQIAAFATGLRIKGETAAEMTGMVKAMLAAAAPLEVPGPLLDTCGTGGDRAGTFNVSTLAALVAAGAGQRVAKHGNRAASGRCGSRRPAGGARGGDRPAARGGGGRCIAEVRHRLLLRPRVPPGDAPRRRAPPRAGRPDRLQLPRAPGQPGQSRPPGPRRGRPAHGPGHGRGPAPHRRPTTPWCSTATTAWTS